VKVKHSDFERDSETVIVKDFVTVIPKPMVTKKERHCSRAKGLD